MGEDTYKPLSAITADDVASEAGVSRWTVARAFKPGAPVSKRTRDRVMAAADRLGYAPNLLAASLASDRSGLIALLVDDFENPHRLVMIERLSRSLQGAGFVTLLLNMTDATEALLSASQRRVDAAVMIGNGYDEDILETALGARRLRKLIVFAREALNPETLSIYCDDALAMSEIATHLHNRGYQKPLFLAGPDFRSTVLGRRAAFESAWSSLGHKVPAGIASKSYGFGHAHSAMLRAWTDGERPDVVVCENDSMAMGVMDALRSDLGLHVPTDVAVTGFDDTPTAGIPAYGLTTYRQPLMAMADALTQMLLDGSDTAMTRIALRGTFVARSST
jgi:DNA-binding LacI/PurR family transcriptional regulator